MAKAKKQGTGPATAAAPGRCATAQELHEAHDLAAYGEATAAWDILAAPRQEAWAACEAAAKAAAEAGRAATAEELYAPYYAAMGFRRPAPFAELDERRMRAWRAAADANAKLLGMPAQTAAGQ